MPPLNPYMLGSVAVVAAFLYWQRMRKPQAAADDTGDESDPYTYGHAPREGGGGGGGMPLDLAGLERGVQNYYDGSGFVQDFGAEAPSTSESVDFSPAGTQDPSAPSLAVTGAGAGAGLAGTGLPSLAGALGIGGVAQPSAPVASAIASSTFQGSGYSGGYAPLGASTAPYVPGTSSAGGGGATRF